MSKIVDKRVVGVALVALLALVACGFAFGGSGPDITPARVQGSVGPAFIGLYQDQRQLLGLTPMAKPTDPTVCSRTGRGIPDNGAGDDWICQISLSVDGLFQSIFTYELSVQADGCYTADGSPSLIGGANLTTPSGTNRVNPLFEFYGCFDT